MKYKIVWNAGIFGEIVVVVSHKNVLQRGCLTNRIKRSSRIETAKVVRIDRNKIIVFLVWRKYWGGIRKPSMKKEPWNNKNDSFAKDKEDHYG